MVIASQKNKEDTKAFSGHGASGFLKLFKMQVQKAPHATCAIFEEESLSYEQLDLQSTNIAKLLKIRGVRPGKVVALGVYNRLELLIGMLAIFKAGGTYLPIDPNYPVKRIEVMLNDAKPHIFITESALKEFFFDCWKDSTLLIDLLPDLEFNCRLTPVSQGTPAYITYTSGSTGEPKGIIVDHVGLTHAALAYKELHPDKHISLMLGSISFDPSLLTIVHTLSLGGSICLPQNNNGIDPKQPDEIIKLIRKHDVGFILCTPSLYSMILTNSSQLPSLKCVDLCGESIPTILPKIHAKIAINAFLYNVYGPSEYAMGATAAQIYNPGTKKLNEITIGTPFSANRVYILNKSLKKVSVGEKGEIFIGGPGLSVGYLNLKSLTKKKFPIVSLSVRERVRLYRTGDMGCFLPDGNIQFLGRNDRQVKISGHRVELEEIECTIYRYSKVNKVIIMPRLIEEGKRQLIAYFSTPIENEISRELEKILKEKLPSYMVPSIFIQVEKWPYNQNGKVDHIALEKLLPSALV